MTRDIPLTRGYVATVDDEDYDELSGYKWSCLLNRAGRPQNVQRAYWRDGRAQHEYMHTRLTGYALTDHANGDPLDNRRSNLRPATVAESVRNSRSRRGTSVYKGVWTHSGGKWQSAIRYGGKQRHLGTFGDEISAAYAYDAAAREHFGEFAALNFPEPGERSAME